MVRHLESDFTCPKHTPNFLLHCVRRQTKSLNKKVTCLKRQLVFSLACRVMRNKFDEAGLGPGNDPNPPSGPVAVDAFEYEAPGTNAYFGQYTLLKLQNIVVQRFYLYGAF